MDKENKKQICEILKSRIENQENLVMERAGFPQSILKVEASILERRKKAYDSFCNSL